MDLGLDLDDDRRRPAADREALRVYLDTLEILREPLARPCDELGRLDPAARLGGETVHDPRAQPLHALVTPVHPLVVLETQEVVDPGRQLRGRGRLIDRHGVRAQYAHGERRVYGEHRVAVEDAFLAEPPAEIRHV